MSDALYTEKEKKSVDKVERMNRFFDKALMPAIGVLIIITLLSFTVGRFRQKFSSRGGEASSSAVSQEAGPEVFRLRRALLSGYSSYTKEFAAYGYSPVDGYSYELSLCKQVDEEMSIFQFSDPSVGQLTIINYFPSGDDGGYDSLSLAVSSHRLLNVTVRKDSEKHSVSFTDTSFSSYSAEDEAEFSALSELVSMEDISAMYEIFETDIGNLAEGCGLKN